MIYECLICRKTYVTKVALATLSSDVVPAGSQNKSTRRNLFCRWLAAKNRPNTTMATIQNQGEKKLPTKTAIPVAFSLLKPRKGDHGPGMHSVTNKAARALTMPLR
jgi:hypothetical protein